MEMTKENNSFDSFIEFVVSVLHSELCTNLNLTPQLEHVIISLTLGYSIIAAEESL